MTARNKPYETMNVILGDPPFDDLVVPNDSLGALQPRFLNALDGFGGLCDAVSTAASMLSVELKIISRVFATAIGYYFDRSGT